MSRRSDHNPYVRLLRVDCSSLSERDAVRYLQEYREVVTAVAKRMQRSLPYTSGLDIEDLEAVGRFAVLEAVLTYDSASDATLRTWVGQVVRWRMSYQVELTDTGGTVRVVSPEEAAQLQDFAGCTDGDLDEQLAARQELEIVSQILADMPIRTRYILVHRLQEASGREIASGLGISVWREQQIVTKLREDLRQKVAAITGPDA